ncbi:class I SAM-dependent methyltransferase [Mycolicibacillus trivialis]|uniref:S-adenosyl-L-methionine-dependent methyltransferase n=1 Tax=Mycolicibacillus trivialis TaxID=1798 RepID=A0A1X2EHC8_9MYCO|nr:class I SAM-dependent methyltransferase [Mycolicibacillus trivialis]ORX02003.1 SAM-dependent methyltransferase [Mycolicibacillus trivialis]
MARSDSDSWDLASSVGATATMVAVARALASREPDALIDDPFAAPLVRAVGVEFFTRLVDGEISAPAEADATAGLMTAVMAVRTRFFDDFFTDAADAGIDQAVILASGLDSRAYRLGWPAGTTVYEIDQPQVIEFKTTTLAELGAKPTADRRTVAVDLRHDWPAALREAGFDPARPTAWSAEGLLAYLPPDAQDRLFNDITALSAPGSRLATEYHPDGGAALGARSRALSEQWRAAGFDLDLGELFYPGERQPADDYLRARGWQVTTRTRAEVFAGYGRDYPDGTGPDGAAAETMRNSTAVLATRT